MIGGLRYLAVVGDEYVGPLRFVRQTPAQAKSFGTDDKLRRLGWYTPTPGGHANDAARHLLAFAVGVEHYTPLLGALTD